jgi:hypothetical protein
LHGIWGDVRSRSRQVQEALLNSPQIRYLGLSISEATTERIHSELSGQPWNHCYAVYFDWIGKTYRENKYEPANQQFLRLGWGINSPYLSTVAAAINPEALEEIYILNMR